MKIQHLIPILFLAAFCTVSAQTNNLFLNFETNLARQIPHRTGTVRYPSGEPAAGVHVMFYPGSYSSDDDYNYHEAVSDKNGHYEIVPPKKVSNIAWGQPVLTNCIMARDLENDFATVEAFPVAVTNVDLILQPAITLSGSVKNTEGAPVSGAEIGLGFVSAPYGYYMRPPFKANEQGQFSIPALRQGVEYWISGITAKGYGTSTATVKAKDTQTNHYEFSPIVLKHANRIIAGRVLEDYYQGERPLAGAHIFFSGVGQPENSGTNTDSDGNFSFDSVCDGPLKLFANYTDPEDYTRHLSLNISGGQDAEAGDTNILIHLKEEGFNNYRPMLTAQGMVFDPEGKPAPNVVFSVWGSANPFLHAYSKADGKYRIRWQENRLATLVGRDPSRNLYVTQEIDGTVSNLDLYLQSGLTVAGVVQDENGNVITNANISLNLGIIEDGRQKGGVNGAQQTFTDNRGAFHFAALPPDSDIGLDAKAVAEDRTPLSGAFHVFVGDTNLVLKLAYHEPGTILLRPARPQPSGRRLTEEQVVSLAEPVLPNRTDQNYHLHFTNGNWVVTSKPISGGVGHNSYRGMTIRDSDGKVIEKTPSLTVEQAWKIALAELPPPPTNSNYYMLSEDGFYQVIVQGGFSTSGTGKGVDWSSSITNHYPVATVRYSDGKFELKTN